MRSLLRLRETDTPSLLETSKAERVINLEEAIGREGESTKSSLEKQLKEALADLNDEIKKRPSYKEPIVEINKDSPIDVDVNDKKTTMDIDSSEDDDKNDIEMKEKVSWAEICESDDGKSDSDSPSIDAMLNEDITGPNSKKNQNNETLQDIGKSKNCDKNPNTEKGSSLAVASKNDEGDKETKKDQNKQRKKIIMRWNQTQRIAEPKLDMRKKKIQQKRKIKQRTKTNQDRNRKKGPLKAKKPVRNKKKTIKSITHTKKLRQSSMVKTRGRMEKSQ